MGELSAAAKFAIGVFIGCGIIWIALLIGDAFDAHIDGDARMDPVDDE